VEEAKFERWTWYGYGILAACVMLGLIMAVYLILSSNARNG
jgi:hypothetical protein